MTKSSRYVRPERPRRALVLQERDLAVLEAIGHYGHVSSEHLGELLFAGVSRRIVQGRLRQLWEHGLVERSFPTVVLTSAPGNRPPMSSRPLYSLSREGAALIGAGDTASRPFVPATLRPVTFEHDLIVTDLLVALTAACRDRSDVALLATEPEALLRQKLSARREHLLGTGFILPDGACTLGAGGEDAGLTFYLEVVRADARGGNARLISRLERYIALLRAGFFGAAYGHDRVRAVLVVTTSSARADHLQELATRMPHGRRLFWFGSWQEGKSPSHRGLAFNGATILDHPWRTAAGETLSFLQAIAPAGAGASPSNLTTHAPRTHNIEGEERIAPHPRRDDLPATIPPVRPSSRGSPAPPVPPREDRVG